MKPLNILINSFRDFVRDDGVVYSACLAFFTVTAIVPLCLFLITVFGYLLGEHRQFLEFFTEKLVGLFPAITTGITEEVKKLITYRGIGKMSIVLYAFLSFQIYQAMHKAMEVVFKVKEKRSVAGSLVLSVLVVTMLVSLILLSFVLTSAVPLVGQYKDSVPWLKLGTITSFFLKFVFPLLLVQSAAVIIYIILPKRKIMFTHALWGGLFTALMLEAAKHVFTWYVGSVMSLGTIYGSLTAFIIFLLWVFYSSTIFLIGGEIVHNLGDYDAFHLRRRASDL